MKLLPLSRGLFSIVDDDDFEFLSQWKWFAFKASGSKRLFYAIRTDYSNKKILYAHKLLLGAKPGMVIDHINGNSLDNRRANLRHCSIKENVRNQAPRVGFTSKYKGVAWRADRSKWTAYICPDRKKLNLGVFRSEHNAAYAYDKAALKHFGQYARINFPSLNTNGMRAVNG